MRDHFIEIPTRKCHRQFLLIFLFLYSYDNQLTINVHTLSILVINIDFVAFVLSFPFIPISVLMSITGCVLRLLISVNHLLCDLPLYFLVSSSLTHINFLFKYGRANNGPEQYNSD